MECTGELEKDATEEQIVTAKKTIKIITEFNGQQYVRELDGTQGLVVLVEKGNGIEMALMARNISVPRFVRALLNNIPQPIILKMLTRAMLEDI